MSHTGYGSAPTGVCMLNLSETWQEFLHYLYLPVRIPKADPGYTPNNEGEITAPRRLGFLTRAAEAALSDARATRPHLIDPYVYITARRGYASPGNPLNRPGWHTDDWGGTDLNYIWTDKYPTRFMLADQPLTIPGDDTTSMATMERLAEHIETQPDQHCARNCTQHGHIGLRIEDGPLNVLLRLTPNVIHATPDITDNGGMRSFFKISVSSHRYNLLGNSHNNLLDYDWPMYDRQEVRNQPVHSNGDYYLAQGA